jgi:hypothetical protein
LTVFGSFFGAENGYFFSFAKEGPHFDRGIAPGAFFLNGREIKVGGGWRIETDKPASGILKGAK